MNTVGRAAPRAAAQGQAYQGQAPQGQLPQGHGQQAYPGYPAQQPNYADQLYAQPAYPPQQPQGYPPQQAYAQSPQYPSYADPAPAANPAASYGHQPAYHFPQAAEPAADPYGRSQNAGNYAPQFDPYTPPTQPPSQGRGAYGQPSAYEPEPTFAPQPPAQYGAQQAPQEPSLSSLSAHRGRPQFPEYNQSFGAPEPAESWPPQSRQPATQARGYEPAPAFPPPHAEPQFEPGFGRAGHQEPSFGRAPQPAHQEPAFGSWEGHDQYAPPEVPGHVEPAFGDMAFEPQQRHDDHGQPMQAEQAQQQGGALAASYEQDDGDYEYDEPKKRSSLLMVVGALSAAIVVGGGAAYVYQKMLGGNGAQIAAPLIKGDPSPSKTKPADAGGKQFAHTGSKVMGRVNDGSAPPEGSGDVDASGARRVTTLPVGRDGSIAAPAPIAPVTPAVAVPGLTIVDGFGRPPQAPIAPPQPPQQAAAPVIVQPPPSAPAKPVMIARAAPATAVIPAAPAVSDVAEEAPAAPVAPKVVKKPPSLPKKKVVDAFGATTGAVATAPASTGGSGFVPVLVSIPAAGKTNADALAQFADMRARYAGVLDGREPVIKEIDRGDKGLYYRVMAGPPGSKEQANALCEQLKAQGHKDCWVSGY